MTSDAAQRLDAAANVLALNYHRASRGLLGGRDCRDLLDELAEILYGDEGGGGSYTVDVKGYGRVSTLSVKAATPTEAKAKAAARYGIEIRVR